ncbi:MAG: pantetheine-phosphate adenylyltransferase [bacterium]
MTAVYPGSFDPITNGHVDIIERSCSIFNKVIVAVAINSEKAGLFTPEERVEIIKETFKGNPKIEVVHFKGLLINYVKDHNIKVIIRGLRAVSDFEYEFQMALMNKKLWKDVETVFMMSSENNMYVSSRIVKEIFSLGGCVKDLVPDNVRKRLEEKFKSLKKTGRNR